MKTFCRQILPSGECRVAHINNKVAYPWMDGFKEASNLERTLCGLSKIGQCCTSDMIVITSIVVPWVSMQFVNGLFFLWLKDSSVLSPSEGVLKIIFS